MNRVHNWIKVLSTWCVGLLCALAFGQAGATTGAVNTTDDPTGFQDNDSYATEACLNGGPHTTPSINCNGYGNKRDVFLSGLVFKPSQIGGGTYFFAVLDPGGQQDPNDGAPGNLSTSDTYVQRTFTVDNTGAISYAGPHSFDPAQGNIIQLWPYADTSNPGGVYILAVCQYDPATVTTGAPGVAPATCKYDAFHIQPGGPVACESDGNGCPNPPIAPTVTKDAAGSYDEQYTWTIDKSVNKTNVTVINDGSGIPKVEFDYTVTVTKNDGPISNVAVDGTISVFNANVDPSNNTVSMTIDSVVDQLLDDTGDPIDPIDPAVCSVTGGDVPGTVLSTFQTDFPYTCTLGSLPSASVPVDNEATVSWSDQTIQYTAGQLSAGSASFTLDDVQFTVDKVTDDCVTVTDTLIASTVGGTICASQTFTYSNYVTDPGVGKCTIVDNTAAFTTSDTGATGSDGTTVQVCHYRAALTMGYWKNHAANSKSGGPSYSTDCSKLKNSSCSTNGVWTIQYLPQSLGNYLVNTIVVADGVWGAANCSATTDQGAAGCLAGQLLAAELNRAAGSCPGPNPGIDAVIANANAFLKGQTVNGVVGIVYTGPSGKYTFTAAQRALAVSLKTTLDSYNNGNGC